jgi:putative hydrolase
MSREDLSIDRTSDLHTHSSITDGSATPHLMAEAAVRAGLRTWGISEHVHADSTWLDGYLQVVLAMRVRELDVRVGVEAKILDQRGRLDLPRRLPRLDYVMIADHDFPGIDAPIHSDVIRRQVRGGELAGAEVLEQLVRATCEAVARAPLPAIVVHPFSLLAKCGLSEGLVTDEILDELAKACVSFGALVEVNERWRCPSARIATGLAARGVELCAGSDAHRVEDVGDWRYVNEISVEGTSLEGSSDKGTSFEGTSERARPRVLISN